jgi:hypothetical protein
MGRTISVDQAKRKPTQQELIIIEKRRLKKEMNAEERAIQAGLDEASGRTDVDDEDDDDIDLDDDVVLLSNDDDDDDDDDPMTPRLLKNRSRRRQEAKGQKKKRSNKGFGS